MRILCILVGCALILSAIADRIILAGSEKQAHYIVGHWFDAVWEVQLPLVGAGVVIIAFGFFKYPRVNRT